MPHLGNSPVFGEAVNLNSFPFDGVAGGCEPEGLRRVIRSMSSEAEANMAFEQTELVQGLRKEISSSAFGSSAID